MSITSKANKENFRLLDLSSDEESEDLQLEIIPNRKKKISRKERNRGVQSRAEPNIGQEVQCALCWAVRGTLVLWLLMLTWICAALYDQVTTMRVDIAKVTTTSGGVGDALQVCHTAAKELKANASELSARILKLELQHEELSQRMKNAQEELALVSGQLSAAPKLADTPRRIAELQRTVADFGSQIKGFDSAIESAHKQALTATSSVEELRNYVVHLEERTNDTIANVSANWKRGEEFGAQLVALNTTIGNRMDGLQAILDGMKKPVEKVAESETPVATNAPTAAPTTTTTLPPGPTKPSVLKMKETASS
ncbi:uncharacterized protein LOC119831767 isoform X2 [Zerene cesonia]|uniref:uncharacterized protein LOC119831767 isoform X2 n=1 Tax=Zerene cesonia TaxID=33412 RepID=UPI0018E51250|nr:uncharacterized protein LOC119831767 isoform X2 [Zerene cesonia]